ncbi:hypothetical protein SMD14_08805 [Pseudarthrobacter oxydans]|nr:hypothetical protein [Pseudarthrobacter oxydans]WPU11489.1 hypothetical protein SMD14_08805 [Pseudarthrobacter oxydans]
MAADSSEAQLRRKVQSRLGAFQRPYELDVGASLFGEQAAEKPNGAWPRNNDPLSLQIFAQLPDGMYGDAGGFNKGSHGRGKFIVNGHRPASIENKKVRESTVEGQPEAVPLRTELWRSASTDGAVAATVYGQRNDAFADPCTADIRSYRMDCANSFVSQYHLFR